MAKRRTKLEMVQMENRVTHWLLNNDNNPHKAWDSFIKYHLESKSIIPHYIKGIEDFNKVSKMLNDEIKQNKAEQQLKQTKINSVEQVKEKLFTMSKEDFKPIYHAYKDIVSESHKLNLVNIYMMIAHNDYESITDSEINTLIYNDIELREAN